MKFEERVQEFTNFRQNNVKTVKTTSKSSKSGRWRVLDSSSKPEPITRLTASKKNPVLNPFSPLSQDKVTYGRDFDRRRLPNFRAKPRAQ
jgi:muramidase (phage lysozyme)